MARENSSAPPEVQKQVDAPPGFSLQPTNLDHLLHQSTSQVTHKKLSHLPDFLKSKFDSFRASFIYGAPNFSILSGDDGMSIAKSIGQLLNGIEIPPNTKPFANGEKKIVIDPKTAEKKDVYIIQSVGSNPDSSLRELKHLELAAKSAKANRIIAIFTQLPYARQDRIEQPGAADAARNVIQEILDAGSHNYRKRRHQSKLKADAMLITIENHSEGPLKVVEKDSKLQWANLDSLYVFKPKLEEIIKENNLDVVIGYPDKGASQRYKNYVDTFAPGTKPAVCDKVRDIHENNKTKIVGMTGNVDGKDVLLPDDILDTGGTTLDAAREFKKHGAKSVRVIATHGIFSNDALGKMNDSAIDGVIISDTLKQKPEVLAHPKIEIVSIAPLIAEAIMRMENREPLGELVKSKSGNFEKSYMKFRKINKYRRRETSKN